MDTQTNKTVPAMPAAIKGHPSRMNRKMTVPAVPTAMAKFHRPTLMMKTAIELQEEREPGRYSIIPAQCGE
jgi:hypothetical protein